jgi:hypothetical protein
VVKKSKKNKKKDRSSSSSSSSSGDAKGEGKDLIKKLGALKQEKNDLTA